MKTTFRFICFLMAALSLTGCQPSTPDTRVYLQKVLTQLEGVKSAVYYTAVEGWHPGDTVPGITYSQLNYEYDNPADKLFGATFVYMEGADTTKLSFAYDGNVRVLINHDKKKLAMDDFTKRPLPFRPMNAPFFNYTKNIIKYALETTDSISTELEDGGDHYFFRLTIHEEEQIEFFGKAHRINNPYLMTDPTSVYEMWISKKDNLPYRVRRDLSHDITVTTCLDPVFNTLSLEDFSIYTYLPVDYEIVPYRQGSGEAPLPDLTGQQAPVWTLNDMNEKPVSLDDFQGKVVLINITGIGCGPCQLAMPYLKALRESYTPEELSIVAIESWTRAPHSLQNYVNRNEINYPYLSATDEVIRDYQTGGMAPMFFILDKDHVVQKVWRGFSVETTMEEIKKTISELM